MFALALWDAPARRLFLARDRLGIKPLYYAIDRNGLWFGSEQKALLAAERLARAPLPRGDGLRWHASDG